MSNKNYSIITNFGCHWQCPYCIVRNNDIEVPKTILRQAFWTFKNLTKYDEIDFLSFSGGGDPLHNMDCHVVAWYKSILYNCKQLGIFTEMHTSYLDTPRKLLYNYLAFDRIVYHLRSVAQIKRVPFIGDEIVRVVFVVQEHFTEEIIQEIVRRCKEQGVHELSFRQRIDSNYQETFACHEYLKAGHLDDWHYIEQDDYNNYIVNDKIYKKYEDIKYERNYIMGADPTEQ